MATDKPIKKKLSRQEQRDLDVEISFLEGVVKRDRNYVEALQLLGDHYTKRGRLTDGLAIDRRLARLCPQDPLVFYNLACSYSLTCEFRKAANSLRKALSHGYRDFKWLRKDPDLEPLRQQPVFARIEAEIAGIQ
ncbi:MAG: hypothetical protein CMO64_00665 [Verrucomicrobiales bacterium]|nr:hypothetical protein [Verrucomicrobiales bacterium]